MRRILLSFILILAAPVIAMKPADSNNPTAPDEPPLALTHSQTLPSGAIVIHVFYYAKPGKADEVLSHRQHASDVLETLGLPRGQVLRRVGGSDEQPDVMWECEFPNVAARDQFLKVASASPDFDAVRKHMATLIRSAERRDWEVQRPPGKGR